ncbi:Mannan endo-14-beta-mannosidase B [Dissostichus eleginoides]|uniref:Mannan endo-14-beta-mannosidase B n=1 Tax=Dissostichus eleginoides TaxID=100907 RepID=A0AAD9C3J8_DISEL|nr:Mannan endo-14-beta-mannosidase B [Dissostichus eleginoides]
MHIIARSPASSSELLIGVPSEFDTNIYTTDAHQGARKHTDPLQPPPVCKKFPSIRFVTAGHKDVIKQGEEGGMRGEGAGEGERLLHLSQLNKAVTAAADMAFIFSSNECEPPFLHPAEKTFPEMGSSTWPGENGMF